LPIERSHLLHQLDTERRTLARIGETLEQDEHITRLTSSDGSHHTIIFSSLDSENADAIIVRETAHYRGLLAPSNFPAKMEVEWKLYEHDAPADLINKLETAGFEIGACESVVALDLSDHHDWIDDPLANHVERVTTLEQVNLYRQTAELIFHKNYAYTANELSRGIATGSTEHIGYLAFDSTMATPVPVSIGRLYTHANSLFGGLYGGATLPSHRGLGFYRALTAARARDARRLGAKFLIVDALPTSLRILMKLGFVEITKTWPCTLRPAMPAK
jgi:hypothetical protein